MPEALPFLPLLAEITAYFFAWGFCILVALVVAALFAQVNAALGWVPWLGPRVQAPLHSIEQKITSELSKAVGWLDHRMALTWYKMAHLAEWIGHEIAANAGLMANLAALVWNPLSVPAWQAILKALHLSIGGATAKVDGTVHTLTRPITGRVARLERRTHLWYLALHAAIAVTIPGEFAGLRGRTRTVEDLLNDAWGKIKANEKRFAALAFAGLVAHALSRLGAGWTRCAPFKNNQKALCSLNPGLFESLLAGALVVGGSISLVDLAKSCQQIMSTCEDGVAFFIREVK